MDLVSRIPGDMASAVATALLAAATAGCVRDPVPEVAAALEPGDLVVSELRGDQSGVDGYGEWIEIYNASDADIDLVGVEVVIQRIDGSASGEILVRQSLPVAGGDYAVLGRFAAGEEPSHVDQGWLLPCAGAASGCDSPWLDGGLYDAAAVDIIARGVTIDRAIYRDLPSTGRWALGGPDPPTSAGNDDEGAWCADQRTDADSATLGIKGSPGEDNPPCP